MVWRQLNGQRNGVYGGWISKPGYDVTTCSPGDFLLDTNSKVFQSVMKGDSAVVSTGPGQALGAGTYSTSVGLPSAFSGYSNLIVQGTAYIIESPTGLVTDEAGMDPYISYRVSSGSLVMNLVCPANVPGVSGYSYQYRLAWSIFRAQF